MPQRPDLIIFAKQPVAGQVKTRLQPDYTAEQAASVAAELIRLTVELAVENWPDDIYLYGAPDADHPLFADLADRYGLALRNQAAGDLGARMQAALAEGIARRGAAAILGCDVPHASWDILDDANHFLARGRSVLGPTKDGGYYLIGLTTVRPGVFANVPWGTSRVLDLTIERARESGVEFTMLPRLADIDTTTDLWAAAQKKPELKSLLYR